MTIPSISQSPKRLPFFLSPPLRPFSLIWLGQLVSLFGSGLTAFGLGLWVYQRTGSVTQYALISMAAVLPRVLLSPLAGALVDRWDRRWTMLLGDFGAGLCSLAVAILLFARRLEVWQVVVAVACSAAFGAFQSPAYAASISLLVPGDSLSRANGMLQLGQSIADLSAPLAAGFLILAIRIQGILLIDFLTFLVAVGALLAVRIPRPPAPDVAARPGLRALFNEAWQGWRFISDRPGLTGLLLFTAVFNFLWGMVGTLIVPLILGFSDSSGLGAMLSLAGVGMLAGSLLMSAWARGPRRKIPAILGAEVFSGLCFILIGLRPSLITVAYGVFGAHLTIAVIGSSSRTLWQRKVAPAMQGRVFATQEMIARSAAPLAIALAGPLAERVFQPFMSGASPIASNLGALIGSGAGRGIALMFILMGLLKAASAAAGALYHPLRTVEADLPDQV
jgi:MFS transporter, DHA3 family, macrolide efflux protein